MSKRKKAEAEDVEIERSDVFVCLTCKPEKVFDMFKDSAALKAHLADEHGVTPKDMPGRVTMHLDGRTWFGTNYEFSTADGTVRLVRQIRSPRDRDDMMRYA